MTVSDTSIAAYTELQQQRKLQPMEQKVLDALTEKPLTREEIAESTGMRLSSVCGRVASLRASGLVQSFGEKRCEITNKRQELIWVPR